MPLLDKTQCIYTPYYCEENVWQMCKQIEKKHPIHLNHCRVVFISNSRKNIPLWHQQAGDKKDGLVVWDYHVILLQVEDSGCMFYDLDTTLTFPSSVDQYISSTLRPHLLLKPEFQRYFRVVEADNFLKVFASDRSHMKDEEGKWKKPPPVYSPIKTTDSLNNLPAFISMDPSVGFGKVYNCEDFMQFAKYKFM